MLKTLKRKLKYIVLISLCFHSFFSLSQQEETYYETLLISKKATAEEIKKAYQRQVMKYHPDRLSQDESLTEQERKEQMIKINEAYNVLKDPEARRQYDQFVHLSVTAQSQSQNVERDFYRDFYREFYDAFENAVHNSSNGFKKAFYFNVIKELGFRLNDVQVHSIVKVVVDVGNEYELVRRHAIAALEKYVEQLFIEDIELLLILSSSLNKIDDKGIKNEKQTSYFQSLINWFAKENTKKVLKASSRGQAVSAAKSSSAVLFSNQGQNDKTRPFSEKGIKKRAEEIVKKWFKIKFQYSFYVDQILTVIVDPSQKYETDFFRKGALDAIENNIHILTPEQINVLQSFETISHHPRRLKQQVKRIITKWNKLDPNARGTAVAEISDNSKTLIRAQQDVQAYNQDPVLYHIKSIGESITYLNQTPNLSLERVNQVTDYTLIFMYSLHSGIHFIKAVHKAHPDSNKEKLIEETISYLSTLTEAQNFVNAVGELLLPHHFNQIINQVMPFIAEKRGIRGGTFFLQHIAGSFIDKQQKADMVDLLKNLPIQKLADAEKFINIAGPHLSAQDRQNILSRAPAAIKAPSSSSCREIH